MLKYILILIVFIILGSAYAINEAVLPELRLVNAHTSDTSLIVEGETIHENVASGIITDYSNAPRAKSVGFLTGAQESYVETNVRYNNRYTAIRLPDSVWVVEDDYRNVVFGDSKVRVVQADNQLFGVDVTFNGELLFDNLNYAQQPEYKSLSAGTYTVEVVDANTGEVKNSLAGEVFDDRAVYSIFLMNGDIVVAKDEQLKQK